MARLATPLKLNFELPGKALAALTLQADVLATWFYGELLKRNPAVMSIFAGIDMKKQRAMLIGALQFVLAQSTQHRSDGRKTQIDRERATRATVPGLSTAAPSPKHFWMQLPDLLVRPDRAGANCLAGST